MSMALSSSLRALALVSPALPSARPSGVAVPASRARGRPRRGSGVVALAAALPSDAQWLERLPEKSKPLYTHSLPCIEAWLRSLGFTQSREDPALWVAEMPLWHARLSLDVTDLHIRYKPHIITLPSSKSHCICATVGIQFVLMIIKKIILLI